MPARTYSFFRVVTAVAITSIALLLSGCVSEQLEPEHNPQLGLAQSSDGTLTINLQTKVGYQYTIMYKDPASEALRPLSGCEKIIGDGKMFEIRKRTNPQKEIPQLFLDYVRIQ